MKPSSRDAKRPSKQQQSVSNESRREDPMEAYAKSVESKVTAALRPTFVRVENVSCRHLQRKLLGPTRYWFRDIKQDKKTMVSSKRWAVSLYEVPWRRAVVERVHAQTKLPRGNLFPDLKPFLVGTFDSEKAAAAGCAAAVKARDDANPISLFNNSDDVVPPLWNRFVQVTVISDAFLRLPHAARLHVVLEVLLTSDPDGPENHSFQCTRLRKFGTVGNCVRQLPHLRHLDYECTFVLKTAAQFRPGSVESLSLPLTERLGLSHTLGRTLGVSSKAKPTSKELRRVVQGDVVATKLPHFYHGLPAELKAMMAKEQAALTNGLSSYLQHNSEVTVLPKLEQRKRECARAAAMLQRIFRISVVSRALRTLLRRHRHALTIQRIYRGYVVRVYCREFAAVVALAATHVQAVFRSYASRQRTKAMRARMDRGAVALQRLFRGFKARKLVFWMRYNVASAIQIQRCVRGLFGRERAAMFRHAKYKRTVVVPAAMCIQRVYRGCVGRRRFAQIKAAHHIRTVVVPASIQLQRVARGHLGRQRARRKRRELLAALTLQETYRKYRVRCRRAKACDVRFRNRMASRIGAAARGYLARQVYKRERRKIRVRRVCVPAARTIQRIYRGYVVRKQLEMFKDRVEAATVLQYFWRKKTREAAERQVWLAQIALRRLQAALTMQCAIRSYLARQHMQARRMKQRGDYGQAALKVQCAWRSHCNRVQINKMRELMGIEVFARKLTALKENQENVHFDMVDAKADMSLVTKHKKKSHEQIHDLKQMRLDWELRVPVLEKELAGMTRQDIERGWQDAFETEKLVIHFSMLLSAEEILSKKQQIREYDAEITTLQVECEDLERDADELVLQETALLEELRRLEMKRAAAAHAADTKEAIRRQRLRWKVHSNRVNLLHREQAVDRDALARSLAPPSTNVSYAGAQAAARDTDELVRQHVAKQHAAQAAALERNGSRNPHLLAAADAMVAQCHAILQTGSLAMNLVRTDIRDEDGGMCFGCGHVTCECHLKPAEPTTAAQRTTETHVQHVRKKVVRGVRLGRRRRHHRHTDGVDDTAS
ncbi:Aste57867_20265 [Aphanomyces stellatus]|uniref:Aste57867_20265 protein n=1 Tax=Aphanomyces stellatus TaxID=120398 RepID=A0A485LG41_9STRA|nr:hypothetical protein As57867_020199 [Aphanomyces stellatus]VFT96955.1 Aste57867_20265 [Aphanomyces stellatus]